MPIHREFEDLLTEAIEHPIEGWDFGWLKANGRLEESPVPWNYSKKVRQRTRGCPSLLDLGTGGGELLSTFGPFPPLTVATESYLPNVTVAGRRLGPLGIHVVRTSGAVDNIRQRDSDGRGLLPFRDESFRLIIDRNEAFVAREVGRVLEERGRFITEQTGGSEIPEIRRLLGLPQIPPEETRWNLHLATNQLSSAGLRVTDSAQAELETTFADVGALMWYLLAVPWAASEFSLDHHRRRLSELHERFAKGERIRIHRDGFWLEAEKK